MSKRKKEKKKYHLRLPVDTANLEIIREFVSGIAHNLGFSAEDIHRIVLAVDEASTNIIKHAYKDSENNQNFIFIDVIAHTDRLEINVIDKGRGFNPESVKVPEMNAYLKKMKRGGLGLYLINTLMDQVDYHINPGVHNCIKMIKYIS